LRDHILRKDPQSISKIHIIVDAMSPVPAPAMDPLPPALNFPLLASAGIDELAQAGMQIVQADAIVPAKAP
jgi:hypothetical protein